MIKPPEIYGEWIPLLKEFAEGKNDREVVPAMQAGTIPCFQLVLERFARRLQEALDQRYSRLVEEFQARGNPGSPEAAEGMVENLGRGLFQLKQAVTLPGLPESLRDRFPAEIQDGADRIQDSLEASARQSHSGELQHILQLHPVNRWEEKQNHEQPK